MRLTPENRIKHLEKRIESLHQSRKIHTEEIKDLRERIGCLERRI